MTESCIRCGCHGWGHGSRVGLGPRVGSGHRSRVSPGGTTAGNICSIIMNKSNEDHMYRRNARSTYTPGLSLCKTCLFELSAHPYGQACTSLECDLITLDMTQRLPFKLRPQHLQAAVSRGIHFELLYSTVLRDPTSRRHMFSNAQALTRLLRGRAIVLSSGARNALELRGPFDVINLGTAFGLTRQQVSARGRVDGGIGML